MELRLDLNQLNIKTEEAFRETCFEMNDVFQEAIQELGLVGSGDLLRSQQLIFTSPTTAQFRWPVAYAIYLLLGYTTTTGKEVEGRDWIGLGLQRLDVEKAFAMLLKAKLA